MCQTCSVALSRALKRIEIPTTPIPPHELLGVTAVPVVRNEEKEEEGFNEEEEGGGKQKRG